MAIGILGGLGVIGKTRVVTKTSERFAEGDSSPAPSLADCLMDHADHCDDGPVLERRVSLDACYGKAEVGGSDSLCDDNLEEIEGLRVTDTHIGEALRVTRVFSRVSQIDIAKKIGKSRSYLSLIESGNKKIPQQLVVDYASGLGVDKADIDALARSYAYADTDSEYQRSLTGKVIRMIASGISRGLSSAASKSESCEKGANME